MKYNQPFGVADANAPYVDRNTPGAVSGSVPPAAAIEHPMREIVAAIEAAGLTPDAGDLTQLGQAITGLGTNHTVTVYSAAGMHTFTATKTGWHWIEVYGGGGGAALNQTATHSEGGGGGGYGGKWVYLDGGTSVTVTVGAGGASNGGGAASGTSGLSSSFGSHVSATGGGGGQYTGAGGAGGTGVGGNINLAGQNGNDGADTYNPAGLGGDAAGPHGGGGARNGAVAKWPGGGATVIASGGGGSLWVGSAAAGGVIVWS